MAYESTTVNVERSQAEIRKLLTTHGAGRFAFGEETDQAGVRWAAVSFTHGGYAVRMRVPHKPVDERLVRSRAQRARTKTAADFEAELVEQEAKRIWRVISWNLKARLVAVDEGVETFEEAFLAHLLDERTGRTIFEQLVDDGRVELGQPLLPALPPGGAT
jgi:hypothetical protein